MMQHDTGPMPPNALAQETVDGVRRALQRYAERPSPEPASGLRFALHALAREAKDKAIGPEQLLTTLKGIWQSLPEIQQTRDHTEQMHVLQGVVTICIREYFVD